MKKSVKKILLPAAGLLLLAVSILAVHYLLAGIGIGLASVLIFGPNVEVEKGKTAGIVYVNGKTGPYTRAYVIPKNPNTVSQSTTRQQLRGYARLWKSSTVNQTGFINYAATHPVPNHMGKTVHISGFNWFVKMNCIAQIASAGVSLITTPPTVDTLFPILTGLTVVANTGPDSVTVQPIHIGDYVTGMKIEIFATNQLSSGIYSPYGFKSIGAFNPSPTTAIDVTAAYEAKFSTLQVGLKIFFRARLIMPTGESDLWTNAGTVVTTLPA